MSTKVISIRLTKDQTENLLRVKEKYPGLRIDLKYAISSAFDTYLENLLHGKSTSTVLDNSAAITEDQCLEVDTLDESESQFLPLLEARSAVYTTTKARSLFDQAKAPVESHSVIRDPEKTAEIIKTLEKAAKSNESKDSNELSENKKEIISIIPDLSTSNQLAFKEPLKLTNSSKKHLL